MRGDSLDQVTPPNRQPRNRGESRAGPAKPRGLFFVAGILTALICIALLFEHRVDRDVETNFDVVASLLHRDRLDPRTLEYIDQEHAFRGRILRAQHDPGPRRFELRLGSQMDPVVFGEFQKYNRKFGEETQRYVWPRRVPSSATFFGAMADILPWILFGAILYFLFIRPLRAGGPGGSVLSFGKSRARLATKESSKVTFADVAGVDEAKGELQEFVEFLKNPSRFQRLGGRIPRGMILVGAPGTGKTLLAKAVAGEADVPFFSICGSDFVEMFVGVGASRVRDLFKQARENSPCIIFLDEVDAVGRRRSSGVAGGHDEREQTLNAILVEMDGFNSDEGIIMIAATNRPDVLDPALLRPGRFDREIYIDLPDLRGREEILRVHARKVKLDPAVNFHEIARATVTFSGAELAALVNEAAILAAMNDQPFVRGRDLEEARDKIRWGRRKTNRAMTDEDRRITAYHEAGHALVAHLLPEVEPVHKVTIIPRGMALGATMQLPERDRYHMSRRHVLANLTVLFAGRVAEKLFCEDITAGAQNDIQRATELARRMITEWGMSDTLGPIHYAEGGEPIIAGGEATLRRPYSEATAQRIDDEVRQIVDEAFLRCEKLLKRHRPEMDAIARALLSRETLTGYEVGVLVDGGQIEPTPGRTTDVPAAAGASIPAAATASPSGPAAAAAERRR